MKTEFNDNVIRIDWHDSPKCLPNSSKFRRKSVLESEEKFNEEFDRWFMKDGIDYPATKDSDDEYDDGLPPLLRLPFKTVEKKDQATEESINREKAKAADLALARSLEESKRRMRILMEKRRYRRAESEQLQSSEGSYQTVTNQENVLKQQSILTSTQIHTPTPEENRCLRLYVDEISPITRATSNCCGKFEKSKTFNRSSTPEFSTPKKSYTASDIFASRNLSFAHRSSISSRNESFNNTSRNIFLTNTPNGSQTKSNVTGKRDSEPYNNSMDDEEINAFLSQIPDVPVEPENTTAKCVSNQKTKFPAAKNIRKLSLASKRGKIVLKGRCEKKAMRRCRTFDHSPCSLESKNKGPVLETDECEARLRSSSLSVVDSFWDDDEFTGVDFNAIDAIK